MIIRRTQATMPLDRPFPDENTVAEIYCNEAFTIDNEAVEDWTSSLQMLQTFAAIFSAVLITLIVDSKALLEQDKTEVLVDAMVFLMNNLANGTHRPYEPPKFQPTTQSVLVNCFFFASLCLSIATALAAVLAMQWVTDYGAVTRRAGSTPEERVKRRHFRYQGGQDWRMDTIIGALPIALHLSVLLFFVGLIVWMWGVHHSVFAVVVICGAVAALFYVLTTILAIFYPSCPYRTPLASWAYTLLHLFVTIIFPSSWFTTQKLESERNSETEEETDARYTLQLRRFMKPLLSCLAPPSLTSRDDGYIRHPDKVLMASSLVWLSNQLPISPDIYRRLLVFIDGFSSVVDPEVHLPVVPWGEIFRTLGVVYQSFVEVAGVKEQEFTEFARRTHCLSQPGMKEIIDSVAGDNDEVQVGNSSFPVRLLRALTKSTSLHNSDALRKQRYADEVVLQEVINDISSTPQALVETWYRLLNNEEKIVEHILPMILGRLGSIPEEVVKRRIETILYLISTGRLPWESTVPLSTGLLYERKLQSTTLLRWFRAVDWVANLDGHPQKEIIMRCLSDFKEYRSLKVLLLQNKFTAEEEMELKLVGINKLARWTRPERMLHSGLQAFDQLINHAKSSDVKQALTTWSLTIICGDLADSDVSLDPKHLYDWQKKEMQDLSNPFLRLIACATLGIEWKKEWTPDLLEARKSLNDEMWELVSKVCFRDSPFFNGDQAFLWRLRLRLWAHFGKNTTFSFLYRVLLNFDLLKRVEQEIQSDQLGIDKAGDFLLALLHLNLSYGWIFISPGLFACIPGILVQDTASIGNDVSKEGVQYFSSICEEISADPARLIRLLIELIRADINVDPHSRRPRILLSLLNHAKIRLNGKDLHPFLPSCRLLTRYIRASYQQFEGAWDEAVHQNPNHGFDQWEHYRKVDRGELKAAYEQVISLLEPPETWEGESKDISWSRDLLRPTGIKIRPFEDVEHARLDDQSDVGDSREVEEVVA